MKIVALISFIFVPWCAGQSTNRVIVPVEQVWEKSWEQPRLAEVSIAWEPSPDAVTYNVYMLSARTTNKWVIVSRDVTTTSVVFMADMSVNIYTRITAVGESKTESAPTNPVKHPSVIPPRPPGQHRHMYTRELTEMDTRRSRVRPEFWTGGAGVLPPLPP